MQGKDSASDNQGVGSVTGSGQTLRYAGTREAVTGRRGLSPTLAGAESNEAEGRWLSLCAGPVALQPNDLGDLPIASIHLCPLPGQEASDSPLVPNT